LSANKIGPDGVKALAGAIAKSEAQIKQMVADGDLDVNIVRPMEHLHLGSTAMASDGFSAISVMVLLNSSLQSLSLCDNHLDDQDMLLLSQALTQNNRKIPLELLHLSFNYITCHGVECLMNAVWGSSTLREIKLDNNRIKDRGVQLCAVVLTSIDLQTIDLSFNKATNIGIKALMKTLTDNTSLKCLAISGIPIDQTASKAVSYALAYNNTLNALYLDSCSTGYASQRHIVAGAVSNSRSSLRILTGFGISREYNFQHLSHYCN
jgi:Ran GTPase-activating protein (RanGAP) involved in mRNA processing and transport